MISKPNGPLRSEVEVWIFLLKVELVEIKEIIDWCDELILQRDDPPELLLDLSMSKNSYVQDIIHQLRYCPGEVDRSFYVRRGIEELSRLNRLGRFAAKRIHSLLFELLGHDAIYDRATKRPQYLKDIQDFGGQDDLRFENFINRSDEEQRALNQQFLDEWLHKHSL